MTRELRDNQILPSFFDRLLGNRNGPSNSVWSWLSTLRNYHGPLEFETLTQWYESLPSTTNKKQKHPDDDVVIFNGVTVRWDA